jgi:hypothetical protein
MTARERPIFRASDRAPDAIAAPALARASPSSAQHPIYGRQADGADVTDRKAKSLKYQAEQEHILRLVGAGLIIHWDDLPDDLQDKVIDQAVSVQVPQCPQTSREDVESFIRTVKVRDFNPG